MASCAIIAPCSPVSSQPLVQALAIEFGCFYAPVNERMAAEGGDALILPDNLHPNAAGHGRIAEIFAGATRL